MSDRRSRYRIEENHQKVRLGFPDSEGNCIRSERVFEWSKGDGTLVILSHTSNLELVVRVAAITVLCAYKLAPTSTHDDNGPTFWYKLGDRWHCFTRVINFLFTKKG